MSRIDIEKCVHIIRKEGSNIPDPTDRTNARPTFGNSNQLLYLNPYRNMEGQKSFELTNAQFGLLRRLSEVGGYRFDACTPFDRGTVKVIAQAVRKAAERKCPLLEVEENAEFAQRILTFLGKDGFSGFSISKEWKRNRL
jgi:hypothetical protein